MSEEQTTGETSLETLLALQDEDSGADVLAHRRANLPERARLAERERALARLAARQAELEAERRVHEARLGELAGEVSDVVGRSSRIDERLSGGEVASFRDQEAMATEMGALDKRRRDLDDEQLIVMEAIEPLEAELGRIADERRGIESEADAVRVELAAAESMIDAELAEIAERRRAIAEQVPAPLLVEYERLRRRLDGVAVARLVGSTCSGCHLTLSAAQFDHFRHRRPDEVITCEQCGRILVG